MKPTVQNIERRIQDIEQKTNPGNPPWGYGFLDRMTDRKNDLVRIDDGVQITLDEFRRLYPNGTLVIFGDEQPRAAEV